MAKPSILLQFDGDLHASSFDAVVAVDAGVDHLLQYSAVSVAQVKSLVHGAMFTRGPQDLRATAIFIGGTDVGHAEQLKREVEATFFGPMRVSLMVDANGANTTAAAAVLSVARHITLAGSRVAVLAATGSVGQRVVRLLVREGAAVRVGSRSLERAQAVCDGITTMQSQAASSASTQSQTTPPQTAPEPWACDTDEAVTAVLEGVDAVIAAGAPGIQLLRHPVLGGSPSARVAIDLNAVPPLGIDGVEVTDAGKDRDGILCYGAVGVGGTKMKIHKAALKSLFESNDRVLDAEEIYQLGATLS